MKFIKMLNYGILVTILKNHIRHLMIFVLIIPLLKGEQ
jgi:hypothetical protein